MICECDAPVPSHLRMSHTVIRKPRMHGSPERSPGETEILESKVFTVSSPSLPALSHERPTVTRVFIPLGGPPAFLPSDDLSDLPLWFCFMRGCDFFFKISIDNQVTTLVYYSRKEVRLAFRETPLTTQI